MKLCCKNGETEYEFEQVSLVFNGSSYRDVFGQKNNKTVAETLAHRRYAKFKDEIERHYPESANFPLGEFLLQLKHQGDEFYKRFLNKYGDLEYSIFAISSPEDLEKTGIYAYFSGNNLKYIGRCKDSMKKRVNQGYGKIHPKNCYLDGQATNCHLNARISKESESISLWLYEIESEASIELIEKQLIRQCEPPWNIQRG